MSTEEPRAKRSERLLIAGVIAGGVAGAMALGAVLQYGLTNRNQDADAPEDQFGLMGVASEELDLRINETVFGPDVELTDNFREAATIWARIEAEDAHGVTVDGLCREDTVTIESISGHGWFAGTPGWQLAVSAIVGATTGMLESKDVAKALGDAWKKVADGRTGGRNGDDAQGRSKQRDGWGRDEDGDFARNEGGIIVCFPRSNGPVYAYDEHHLDDDVQREGRLKKHVPDELSKECFFPVRFGNQPELSQPVDEPGVLHILAWDNNYEDNSGDYHVKFRITRNAGGEACDATQ